MRERRSSRPGIIAASEVQSLNNHRDKNLREGLGPTNGQDTDGRCDPGSAGLENVFSHNRLLSQYLLEVLAGGAHAKHSIDVVVTPAEINNRHGTGPLLKRILKGRPNIFSIRARDDWGAHDFGDWNVKISQHGRSRQDCVRNVRRVLTGWNVGSVLCVPFLTDDLMTSIAIQELSGAKLCVYIMDDQNVSTSAIPDEIMREFLERSSLRLATHPELCWAYEDKYGLPFHILPAVVPHELVPREPIKWDCNRNAEGGALIGSFWDQVWFDRLCSALQECRRKIDWFGNNRSPWLRFPEETLRRAGITPCGVISEERLAVALRKYPFVIVPAGVLDGTETNIGVAALSLPGRILFALATSHTPVLVLGSENTSAARFVRHFDVGEVAPYESARIMEAVGRLSHPSSQIRIRRNAAALGPWLSDHGVVEWLAASRQAGCAIDSRFEEAFADYDLEIPALKTGTLSGG
jgi:hypothetical protein